MSAAAGKGLVTAAKPAAVARPITAPEVMRPAPSGRDWTVRAGGASMNHDRAIMNVPEGESAEDRNVRIHELMHARVTPPDLLQVGLSEGASIMALQACEDGRLGATALGLGLASYTETAPIPVKDARRMVTALLGLQADADPSKVPDWHGAACLAVAAHGTALYKPVSKIVRTIPDPVLRKAVETCIAQAIAVLSAHDPLTTIRAAKILDQLLPPPEEGDEDAAPNDHAMTGDPDMDRSNPGEPQGCECNPDSVYPIRPALVMRATNKRVRTRRKSPDAGALTRPAETMDPLGGGRPFTRRQRAAGGVVVIDTSGSMHPTHDQVRDLLIAAPGALVVTYNSESTGDRVNVHVVGEKGRLCAPEALNIGGGNRNDASVLAWADRNGTPGPRVWVSDGQAGNREGRLSPGAFVYTDRQARRMGYVKVPSLAAALA